MKRIFAILLTLALTLALMPATAGAAGGHETHWSAPYIDEARERGWMQGDDETFRPDDFITRGEFAVMLWLSMGSPAPEGECPFDDVPQDADYRDAVTALYELGIVNGYGGGRFGPDDTLTREMGFVMLARAFALTPDPESDALSGFSDADELSGWARDAAALAEKGYAEGDGGKLMPQKPLTRGEMAKLLVVVYDGEIEPEPEPEPTAPYIPYNPPPSPTTYTVTFDENGGNAAANPATKTVYSGGTIGSLPTDPTHASATFGGWNTAADGSGTEVDASTPVSGSITVYAMWLGENPHYPIVIENHSGLQDINNGLDKHYKLKDGVTVSIAGGAGQWTPIGENHNSSFTGSLVGGVGTTITFGSDGNPVIFDGGFAGLFGSIGEKGVVRNVTVSGALKSTASNAYLGGIAGFSDKATIENCTVSASIEGTGSGSFVGGIVGRSGGSDSSIVLVKNCSATGTVTASGGGYAGGIAGFVLGIGSGVSTVQDCHATGAVTATGGSDSRAGGIVGSVLGNGADVVVQNCSATGAVSASGGSGENCAGGVVGRQGGVAANNTVVVQDCHATGAVSASGGTHSYAGGVVGRSAGEISNVATVQNCYAESGTVSASGGSAQNCAGGVVGQSIGDSGTTTVKTCYAAFSAVSATGSGTNYAGGVVGASVVANGGTATVQTCAALGAAVSATGGTNNAERVEGGAVGSGVLARENNYADAGMTVDTGSGQTTPTGVDPGTQEGAGVTSVVYSDENWWKDTGGFWETVWYVDDSTADARPWVWDGTKQLPKLHWQTP